MTDPRILESLKQHLETAVPLWYRQLYLPDSLPDILASGYISKIVEVISQKSDLVLYGFDKGVKPGEIAEAFNALARGIAIASAWPCGCIVFGIHWENGRGQAVDIDRAVAHLDETIQLLNLRQQLESNPTAVYPGVWKWAMNKARENKAWAEEFLADPKKIAQASDWTKQGAIRYNSKSAEELAWDSYRYLRHRARLCTKDGQHIDPAAYRQWQELTSSSVAQTAEVTDG